MLIIVIIIAVVVVERIDDSCEINFVLFLFSQKKNKIAYYWWHRTSAIGRLWPGTSVLRTDQSIYARGEAVLENELMWLIVLVVVVVVVGGHVVVPCTRDLVGTGRLLYAHWRVVFGYVVVLIFFKKKFISFLSFLSQGCIFAEMLCLKPLFPGGKHLHKM